MTTLEPGKKYHISFDYETEMRVYEAENFFDDGITNFVAEEIVRDIRIGDVIRHIESGAVALVRGNYAALLIKDRGDYNESLVVGWDSKNLGGDTNIDLNYINTSARNLWEIVEL